MKIVLANLPWKNFGRVGVRAGSRWPHLKGPAEKDYLPFPFFLAYAGALLKKHDFDVTLIDAIAEEISYGHFLKLIQKMKPHLFLCETSTVTLNHDLRLLQRLGDDIPMALCGPDINIRNPLFLKQYKFIDYVIVGEYEFTLLDLIGHLKDRRKLSDVFGLIYRDGGEIKINPPRPLIDLDKLPWPLREGLPMENYNDTPGDMPLPSGQILASRGCPYRCKFCLWPQVMYQGNRYRIRNVIDVVNEMEYLVKEMGFKSIYFDDDTFNIGKERMMRFCNEIKKRRLNVPWAIMARADLMDEDILKNMREAGLYAVKYGVESATQELLDNIDKNMDLKKIENITKFTKILGIKTHLTFTFGLPGETKESIRKTIDFALRLDPTTVQFSIATPFPGTIFYKEMKEQGRIVSENWAEYDGNYKSIVTLGSITKKDLERVIRVAYKEWEAYCTRRSLSKKRGYYQLMARPLKKYGLFAVFLKVIKFLIRRLFMFFKENIFYKKEIEERIKENGLKIGRLTLLFDVDGLGLYWNGMRLTKDKGFISLFAIQGRVLQQPSYRLWNFQRINDKEILLIRKENALDLEEMWRLKVVDEKQIDWDIEINLKNGSGALTSRIMLILSNRYRTWIDSWGEGRFYFFNDYRKVELRNPNTDFIGLRARQKLKGQLPTILLDFSKDNGEHSPFIRNAKSTLGARSLEVQTKINNGNDEHLSNMYKLFAVRIKIVEEDFNKRKSDKRKRRQ